VTHNPCVG